MGSDSDDGYSLAETFAMILVVADVPIIMIALLVDPLYAVALGVVVLVGGVLAWYLARRTDAGSDYAAPEGASDPVTELQRRYAAGELTESEFEAKLDRLVQADQRAEQAGVDTEDLSLEAERVDR